MQTFQLGDILCWHLKSKTITSMYLGVVRGRHAWLRNGKTHRARPAENPSRYFQVVTRDERVFAVIRDGVEHPIEREQKQKTP